MKLSKKNTDGFNIVAVNEASLRNLDRLVSQKPWPPKSLSLLRNTEKIRAGIFKDENGAWFMKRYKYKGLKRVAAIAGRERAKINFSVSKEWGYLGIAVPSPVGVIEEPFGSGFCWFVCSAIADSFDLHHQASKNNENRKEFIEWVMEKCMTIIVAVHQSGWCHGDMKWANFLSSREGEVFIVDFDSARKTKKGGRRQAKDIARFIVNAQEEGASEESLKKFYEKYKECLDFKVKDNLVERYREKIRKRHSRKINAPV
ncbi:MAG: lipopolysaccharide kinase InaA family protein [Alcanivorax sp.]|nr:lipopolysaccharide kinase InaA family protein [Alcanivorax sp.]